MKRWIRNHKEEYVDECNEIDYTKMAEDLANHFDEYEDDEGTISEEIFDLVIKETE